MGQCQKFNTLCLKKFYVVCHSLCCLVVVIVLFFLFLGFVPFFGYLQNAKIEKEESYKRVISFNITQHPFQYLMSNFTNKGTREFDDIMSCIAYDSQLRGNHSLRPWVSRPHLDDYGARADASFVAYFLDTKPLIPFYMIAGNTYSWALPHYPWHELWVERSDMFPCKLHTGGHGEICVYESQTFCNCM